ncbi:CoA transferase [Pulveribacter sp.]|uniref:CaiB/BaiF CoA transferase family protein n=1 Tax=Pulveribacter sp. TaxID=2678893 RepID=UPI0028AD5077|nr:CoA transferase [Pulveribacter sp.]
MPNPAHLPLHGLRVLDFSELLPGPFFTQSLVEMGAHVIKVERPPHGDNARKLAPGLFASINRGKHSLMVDLKDPTQAQALRQQVAEADVVVEGFRPGVMKRLGFGYEELATLNPRIVYVSLSGYGQQGSMAHMPGHDINYLATAGVLALSGSDAARPDHGAGIPLADLCGAMYALSSTLAALLQRQHTGQGQYLDVSLTDCAAHWMNPRLGHFHEAGLASLGEQREDILAKPAYGVFETVDRVLISLGALEDHFWARLVEVLDLDLHGADYATHAARTRRAAHINAAIAQRIASLESKTLLERLHAADVPAALVVSPSALQNSEHSLQRGLFGERAEGPAFVRYPVRMQGMP